MKFELALLGVLLFLTVFWPQQLMMPLLTYAARSIHVVAEPIYMIPYCTVLSVASVITTIPHVYDNK